MHVLLTVAGFSKDWGAGPHDGVSMLARWLAPQPLEHRKPYVSAMLIPWLISPPISANSRKGYVAGSAWRERNSHPPRWTIQRSPARSDRAEGRHTMHRGSISKAPTLPPKFRRRGATPGFPPKRCEMGDQAQSTWFDMY